MAILVDRCYYCWTARVAILQSRFYWNLLEIYHRNIVISIASMSSSTWSSTGTASSTAGPRKFSTTNGFLIRTNSSNIHPFTRTASASADLPIFLDQQFTFWKCWQISCVSKPTLPLLGPKSLEQTIPIYTLKCPPLAATHSSTRTGSSNYSPMFPPAATDSSTSTGSSNYSPKFSPRGYSDGFIDWLRLWE